VSGQIGEYSPKVCGCTPPDLDEAKITFEEGALEQLFPPIVPTSLLARDLQKWQQHFSFATK